MDEENIIDVDYIEEAEGEKPESEKFGKKVKEAAERTAGKAVGTTVKAAEKTKDVALKTAKTAKKTAKKTAAATKKVVKETQEEVKKEQKKKSTRKPVKTVVVQYMGKEILEEEITDRAIAQFSAVEGGISVKKISLYIKPEENAAYYVINDQFTGRVDC